ncbi:cell division protein FtsL [Pseudohongiella spirulinae]|uniref:Cell division protein FtsL n=1 Tax=Pseudohongiella spirulinae TaxID=1249552 RepID=A0A0S2KFB5_9GAMM|nr:cell division protein FtsL [Pseudohongiella spirulinae]ALO46937.1 Cell division protein FtsL [Pseudohongiella spirulinae]
MKKRDIQNTDLSSQPVPVLRWLGVFAPAHLLLVLLALAVLVSSLAIVVSSFESRSVFHALQQQRELSNELDMQWGQLLIEQSTFGLEGRIERRAIDDLNMQLPDWSQIVVVRNE